MIDVEKILRLGCDEWDVLEELLELRKEAESAVKIITATWQFGMKVNEIELTSITSGLGYKNCLTHDGKWIITSEGEEKEVNIDEETIYKLFEAEYLVQKHLKTKNKETDDELQSMAKLSRYFRYAWDATKKRANKVDSSDILVMSPKK